MWHIPGRQLNSLLLNNFHKGFVVTVFSAETILLCHTAGRLDSADAH